MFGDKAVRLSDNRGLTLIEIMVSVVILTVGSIFILRVLAQVSDIQKTVENRSFVHAFATNKMAEIKQTARTAKEPLEKSRGTVRLDDQRFNWSLESTLKGLQLDLQEITLKVLWKQGSDEHEEKIVTLIPVPPIEGVP